MKEWLERLIKEGTFNVLFVRTQEERDELLNLLLTDFHYNKAYDYIKYSNNRLSIDHTVRDVDKLGTIYDNHKYVIDLYDYDDYYAVALSSKRDGDTIIVIQYTPEVRNLGDGGVAMRYIDKLMDHAICSASVIREFYYSDDNTLICRDIKKMIFDIVDFCSDMETCYIC